MPGLASINIQQWIQDHRDLLKPPVGNKCVYEQAQDFIVMVVGGPNARKDFHYNEGEEFFFQLEGDIVLRTIHEGERVDVPIRQGEIFLLPPKIPHSPQRPAGSVGLVIERMRKPGEKDGCMWFCDGCQAKLYDEYFVLEKPRDIVDKLKSVMGKFNASTDLRTCRHCGTVVPA
jgi:3-hydroxyanthranilate 3,4-dioxygenase